MTEKTTVKTEGAVKKAPTRRKATPAPAIEQPVETVEETGLDTNLVEENSPAITADGKTIGIIAVDNGGDNTKVLSETMSHPVHFENLIATGKPINLTQEKLPPKFHSHAVEWNGKIYLTNLRVAQSKFKPMSSYTDSKASDVFILSTLLAVAKYGYDINYLCTSIPYKNYHSEEEIGAIRERLLGEHTIVIDGVEHNFEIVAVEGSAEAQAGHFYLQDFEFYYGDGGEVTLLEIGSRTVGVATNEIILDEHGEIIHVNPIDEKTDTLTRMGVKIKKITEDEYFDYTSSIFSDVAEIVDENAKVVAFGGGVIIDEIKEGLKKHFKKIIFAEEPLYVQVRGMLVFAQDVLFADLYAEEDDE